MRAEIASPAPLVVYVDGQGRPGFNPSARSHVRMFFSSNLFSVEGSKPPEQVSSAEHIDVTDFIAHLSMSA